MANDPSGDIGLLSGRAEPSVARDWRAGNGGETARWRSGKWVPFYGLAEGELLP